MGSLMECPQVVATANRMEYAAVSAVARRNIKIITVLVGECKQNSMIRSFE